MSGPGTARAIGVMLVDDRTVVREGLSALIEQQPGFRVVGQAGSVEEAHRLEAAPHVIVTEVELPEARYEEAIIALRCRFEQTAILALTLARHPARVQSVLAAGANGYLLKTASSHDLFDGMRAVAAGQTYLQPSLGVDLARWHRSRRVAPDGRSSGDYDTALDRVGLDLTARELEVLRLMACGIGNREIASQLNLSFNTIRNHVQSVLAKLGAHSKLEAVWIATNEHLVD